MNRLIGKKLKNNVKKKSNRKIQFFLLMDNKMAESCCINFNQKIIFSSKDYMWKICENCDLIYQSSKK